MIPIPAFKDNYIWLITDSDKRYGVLVDPGDAKPVLDFLTQSHIQPLAILVTHHHWDHSQGVPAITEKYPVPVYASVSDLKKISLPEINLNLEIFSIPGHTMDHVAYYGGGMLFCGDTLFASGCGRLFEGTAEQMYHSLSKLAALPNETLVYCGHEYTLNNLRFAKIVEPENEDITRRYEQTKQMKITLPSQIGLEKKTNPFLRCHTPSVIAAAEHHAGHHLTSAVDVFRELRSWKNLFT